MTAYSLGARSVTTCLRTWVLQLCLAQASQGMVREKAWGGVGWGGGLANQGVVQLRRVGWGRRG